MSGIEVPTTGRRSRPMAALWRSMSDQRWELAAAGLLGAFASASAVALLGASAWLISRASEMPPVLTLTVAAVTVRFLALSRAVFRYAERLVGHDAAFRGLTQLRIGVYRQLERLAPSGIAHFGRGDLLARLVADVDAALDLPLRIILPWAQAVLVALATVLFLVWLSPTAGLVVGVLSVVALALTPWLVGLTARRAEARMAPARGRLTAAVVRALDATPELSAFGAAGRATARVRTLDDEVTSLNERQAFALGVGGGLGILVQGAAVSAALAIAVPQVTAGTLEPVWLAVVVLLPLALFDVMATLPASALALQQLRGSARRIAELAEVPAPVAEPAAPSAVDDTFRGLRLEGMGAEWVAGTPALRRVHLDVRPGQWVAVVGPSGSGKSTLAAVLMGFLSYTGSVTLSGTQVRDADGDDARRHLGLLSQQAHIFDTSIADNVRIGRPDATDDEVAAALHAAQLTPWLASLPDGAATTVGSFGVAVSGGERQRIALARLLLADRPFVILDEPSEHLDGATADALMDTLAEALADRTVLLITHRLRGLQAADLIVELGAGEVVARGRHEELLAAGGWYAEQWYAEVDREDMAELVPRLPVGRAVPWPGRSGAR
ncbi:MAG: thiol reductant ABC exporter subunit CydC [Actinomycetales bacterium]|nr:thiol reductant ABC exporter subunit CydC [Actinomycetales bacterium]